MEHSWRPEGWKNLFELTSKVYDPEIQIIFKDLFKAYEAGADAMLEALKERGKKVIVTDTVRDNLHGEDRLVSEKVQTGWQVFIPEEEQP